ncbi:MAG: hypothetical protein ACM3OB_04330 [Acidobacteriota bacterium]
MDWIEAKQKTLDLWQGIRTDIGTASPLDLLVGINRVCALCERAAELSPGKLDHCPYCIFYQQFGSCRDVSLEMSECVARHDWDSLRSLVDNFIAKVEKLQEPELEVPAL